MRAGRGDRVVGCEHHEDTDAFFIEIKGRLPIELRSRSVSLGPDELLVVPKAVKDRPVVQDEFHLLLIEPSGRPNTGAGATAAARRVVWRGARRLSESGQLRS
jgi:mannose-6-phosphate isomerase-like protein (cupin superfamily)